MSVPEREAWLEKISKSKAAMAAAVGYAVTSFGTGARPDCIGSPEEAQNPLDGRQYERGRNAQDGQGNRAYGPG